LAGGVQGLGVRPAIFRLARKHGLVGTVSNTPRGVEIEVEGPLDALADFEESLPATLPAAAQLAQLESAPVAPRGRDDFSIVCDSNEGPLATRVPVDLAVCPTCLREIGQPNDRRSEYPFTSCTMCGPRYSVIRAMPFERDDTALADFPLCVDCRHEYQRPRDRRFHAQTIACPACGPRVWCQERGHHVLRYGNAALEAVVAHLTAGKIVAVRGLGGYQLLVDATNQVAVERLRLRKGRRAKPLAVMVESVDAAQQLAFLDETEIAAFCDPAGPIVLVRARANNGLAAAIHPGLDTVGLMRPTTPLHAIVAERCGRPLVCTSGNREGDPLEFEVVAAERRLAELSDLQLHHNREIVRPIDDSVVRVIAGRRVTLRLARGLAPLPLELPSLPPTIALGGFLKAAAAWSNGSQTVLGPHVGDQESLPSRERFLAHLDDVQRLYRFRAEQLVHDLHPEYFSTQWVERQAGSRISVQHHHAHVVAGMVEHGWLDRQVLGVAWDGTGYGTDNTVWGGEFLNCSAATFERVARMRPFRLPGGEAAIREPWRIALAVCEQLADPEWVGYIARPSWPGRNVEPARVTSVRQIIGRPHLSPVTSSAGRLIDAAAAIILGISTADFDGQAAMRLEAAADPTATGEYDFPLSEGKLVDLDWRPLFAGLLADHRRGVDAGVMAMRFHRSLARGIVHVCRRWPKLPVILSGGVFQNRLLTELVVEMHDDKSQPLGLPGNIPPNDGGLAAGQLAVAAARGGFIPCA
jgi:hydrogenase maturation protein HypF